MTALRGILGCALLLSVAAPASAGGAADDLVVSSLIPSYELTLPRGYAHSTPRETPLRYVRSCGREDWANLSLVLVHGAGPLPQNPSGITLEEVLPFVALPPDAKRTFTTVRWQDFDIGIVEYRAVVKDLPVIGLAAVLPLRGKALTITLSGPDPLEKELRDDFKDLLSRIRKASSPWHTAEEFRKMDTARTVGIAGAVLAGLYLPVWIIAFRGHPMRAHWVRTGWFAAVAFLLFYPISSPGETTMSNNLVVNGVVPLAYLLFAARRVKLGIELD